MRGFHGLPADSATSPRDRVVPGLPDARPFGPLNRPAAARRSQSSGASAGRRGGGAVVVSPVPGEVFENPRPHRRNRHLVAVPSGVLLQHAVVDQVVHEGHGVPPARLVERGRFAQQPEGLRQQLVPAHRCAARGDRPDQADQRPPVLAHRRIQPIQVVVPSCRLRHRPGGPAAFRGWRSRRCRRAPWRRP